MRWIGCFMLEKVYNICLTVDSAFNIENGEHIQYFFKGDGYFDFIINAESITSNRYIALNIRSFQKLLEILS